MPRLRTVSLDGNGKLVEGAINNIQCDGQVVSVDSLSLDPLNARLHPNRNLEAIKESLQLYGQRHPLVVREQGRVVAAGNGRLVAMRELGWTKCAVSIRPMTDREFTGYSLADNRTAELAQWDYEVVAMLEVLQQERGEGIVGWSDREIQALRIGEAEEMGNGSAVPVWEDLLECPECGHTFPPRVQKITRSTRSG